MNEDNPFLMADDEIEELRGHYHARRFQEAIELGQRILKANPLLTEAEEICGKAVEALNAEPFIVEHLRDAEAQLGQKEYLLAHASAKQILDLDADHVRAQEILSLAQQKVESEPFVNELITRGEEYFSKGEIDRARTEWRKIEDLDPGNSDVPRLLERCETIHFKKRYTSEEEETLSRLVADGQKHFEDGNYQEALNLWSRILVIDETHTEGRSLLAKARHALEERQREIDEILHRVRDLKAKGLPQEALTEIESLRGTARDNPDVHALVEQLRYEVETAKVRRELESLLADARSAADAREWDRGDDRVKSALSLQPGNTDALALAETIRDGRRKGEAEAAYQDAMQHDREGNSMLAYNEATRALDLDPDLGAARTLQSELASRLQPPEVQEELELEPEPSPAPPAPVPAPPPLRRTAVAPERLAEKTPLPVAQPAMAPTPPTSAPMPPRPAARGRFLAVSATLFLVGVALLVLFLVLRDQILGKLGGEGAAGIAGENGSTELPPLPAVAQGYVLQGMQMLDRKDNLDAIYFFQKVPPDSPLSKKSAALIAQAQQDLLTQPQGNAQPATPPAAAPAAPQTPTKPSPDIAAALAEARRAFASSNFELASRSCARALEGNPESQEAKELLSKSYYNLGILALRELDMAKAESNFRHVLQVVPGDPEAKRQIEVILRYKEKPADHSLDVYLKFQPLRD